MTAPKMILGIDINGKATYALTPTSNEYRLSVNLDQNIDTSFQIPDSYSKWQVVFSFQNGSDVWVAYNDIAEIPIGNTFLPTTSELNPTVRELTGGTIVSCLTEDSNAQIQVSMYALLP